MQILVIDEVHEMLIDGLRKAGHDVAYNPAFQRNDLIKEIEKYEGLIVRTKTTIDEDVLSHAAKLKFVGRAGSGMDNVDTAYCDAKGIAYFNAGEANADAVGEHTLAMLLALFANIVKADQEVRKGVWDREGNRGIGLKGKTIGVIGYGNTGRAVARKLKGFEVTVLAYDKYLHNFSDDFAKEVTMEAIFDQSDVLTLHIPLTGETQFMVNTHYLNRFRKPILLLNLSRGKIVKLDNLLVELEKGKVNGAGLDVLPNEDLSSLSPGERMVFNSLVNSKRTILTPHIGGWTKESYKEISGVLLQKINELWG